MTGTGTQADPYVVSTWDEIIEKIAEKNAYVKCAPGLVFDMNEMFPEEAPGLTFHCLEFDGNGIRIENGRYNGNVISLGSNTVSQTIKNININDFLIQGEGHLIYSYYSSHKFYDCVFSGQLTGYFSTLRYSGVICIGANSLYSSLQHDYYRCGFNIKTQGRYFCTGRATNWWTFMYFHDCHIVVSCDHLSATDCYGSFRMQNSLLQGDLGSQAYICDSHDSIIDADCESIVYSSYDTYSHVIYNSERARLTNVPSEIFTPMTSAELRDASAIAATGFPIGVK
ncbi:MAG: hypothetical protein IJ071_05175 [Ruminococcus sp.]|nr:hypothetical protein [Ruminococcus sp.]